MGRGAAGRPAAAFRIPACLTRDNPRAGVKRPSLFGIPERMTQLFVTPA